MPGFIGAFVCVWSGMRGGGYYIHVWVQAKLAVEFAREALAIPSEASSEK